MKMKINPFDLKSLLFFFSLTSLSILSHSLSEAFACDACDYKSVVAMPAGIAGGVIREGDTYSGVIVINGAAAAVPSSYSDGPELLHVIPYLIEVHAAGPDAIDFDGEAAPVRLRFSFGLSAEFLNNHVIVNKNETLYQFSLVKGGLDYMNPKLGDREIGFIAKVIGRIINPAFEFDDQKLKRIAANQGIDTEKFSYRINGDEGDDIEQSLIPNLETEIGVKLNLSETAGSVRLTAGINLNDVTDFTLSTPEGRNIQKVQIEKREIFSRFQYNSGSGGMGLYGKAGVKDFNKQNTPFFEVGLSGRLR